MIFFQKWDANDYRMARFIHRPKHINPNWAIKFIAKNPPKKIKNRIVWCDGGSPTLGHPKVFINLVSILKSHKFYSLTH